jgi:hypothetical protein
MIVRRLVFGLAFLLLALLNEEFVADHLADDLLGASLRFLSDLVHALLTLAMEKY